MLTGDQLETLKLRLALMTNAIVDHEIEAHLTDVHDNSINKICYDFNVRSCVGHDSVFFTCTRCSSNPIIHITRPVIQSNISGEIISYDNHRFRRRIFRLTGGFTAREKLLVIAILQSVTPEDIYAAITTMPLS